MQERKRDYQAPELELQETLAEITEISESVSGVQFD